MTFPCSVQTDPMQKALVTNNAVQTDSVPTEPCSPQLTHSEAAGVSSSSVGPTTHSRHSFFSTNPFHEDDWASMTQISINQATSGVAQGLSEAVHASVNALPVIRRRIEQIMHHAATSPMVNPNVTQEARPGQTRGFSALDVSLHTSVCIHSCARFSSERTTY
ncbi:hypothetical protein FGIG_11011 [Fasciola gigantica]|uniref:Uncharacterized protein n=1 Tax=Fasciola gigantica TaxID=46835 RepID=A0A504YY47_FASGI|nr:hypothetical protein FGIG_11011 [Fasciola gigantica]